eukprot:3206827-Lingulodinium_polyedra.AAC.1
MDQSGFARFHFPRGQEWVSDIPYLNIETDQLDDISKKPAANLVKKPIMDSSERKRVFSRGYHKALTEFKKRCLETGAEYEHMEAKKHAREQGRLAVELSGQ